MAAVTLSSHTTIDLQNLSGQESNNLKLRYSNELHNSSDKGDFRSELNAAFSPQAIEKVQSLYLALRKIFTPKIENECRCVIVRSFLIVDQDQWPDLVKQICFIMPVGTRGHDVMWAARVLCSVGTPSAREKLVHTANRLFRYDTLTIERGYILDALSKVSPEELVRLDNADEAERAEFFSTHVPKELKEGARVCYIYDPVIEKGWDV